MTNEKQKFNQAKLMQLFEIDLDESLQILRITERLKMEGGVAFSFEMAGVDVHNASLIYFIVKKVFGEV